MRYAALTTRAVEIAARLWPAGRGPLPKITVKKRRNGVYHWRQKDIFLPLWLFDEGDVQLARQTILAHDRADYMRYYIAHELCHALCGREIHHGPAFQAKLRDMVPDVYHFEAGYKPKMYAAEMRRAESCLA